MSKIIPVCPHCGCTRLQYHYSETTAMGWIQIIENGDPVPSNPNIETSYYTCCECNHDFYVKVQFGKIIDTTDEGERKSTFAPTVEMSSTTLTDNTIAATNTITIDDKPVEVKFQWEVDIEEIKKRLDKLEKRVYYSWEQ